MTIDLAGRRVLVTGGTGFLGQYVVAALRRRGVQPHAVGSREADLTEAGHAAMLFEQSEPEVVFHLAARVGGIGANRAHPGRFFYDNMLMGIHVLEQARRYHVQKLVLVGTVCAYPKHAPTPFSEDDLWNGYPEETNAPYGLAKRALGEMARAYRAEYGSPYITIYPANLYGPGAHDDLATSHVIPAVLRKFVEAHERGDPEVVLWGDGTPTREFLYVEDAAEGLVLAAERYDSPDPVNLGVGAEVSIAELAETIREIVGYRGRIVWDPSQPNGQPRRRLGVERAWAQFGFAARTPLDVGLRRTAAWYLGRRHAVA